MAAKYADLRRFLKRTIIGGIPLGCILLMVMYYCFFVRPSLVGDLGELGKIPFDREYGQRMYQPVLASQMKVDYGQGELLSPVVTIGDSFSQQMPNGFQNFLGHLLGHPVSNIPIDQTQSSPEQVVADMLGSGFFDNHPEVKWVIVESVERDLVSRWLKVDMDSHNRHIPIKYRCPDGGGDEAKAQESLGRYFRQGIDWIKLTTGIEESPVCQVKLSEECFTLPGKEDRLYFYNQDLNQISATDDQLAGVTSKIKTLHDRFAEKGIRLLFMPAPDKYELYQHLAVDNPYPERPLGAQLSAALDTLDFVVNPLPELRRRLDAGEKDLFMADDTHWSAKSAELAATLLHARMTRGTQTDSISGL